MSRNYQHQNSGNHRSDGVITAAGHGKVCIPTKDKNLQFRKLKAIAANQVCFDCPGTRPTWASVTYGASFGRCRMYRRPLLCFLSLTQKYIISIPFYFYVLGVYLCLDCSATHRSLGVHTTFVRSLDLDEWTQRQIDAMRLGGNGNGREYFRKHGLTDMHGKIEKKYTSKAAVSYRSELSKLIVAEAAKRGEETADAVSNSGNLLENLALADKEKAAAGFATQSRQPASVAVPTAKLASQNAGARGKLVVTPPNSGGLPMLRKPANKLNSGMMLKKKPSGGGASTKLRINKLTAPSGGTNDAGFDDIETVQKQSEENGKEVKQVASDAAMANQLSASLNGTTAPVAPVAPAPVAPPAPAPAPAPAKPTQPPKSSMEQGMSKLKMMNSDFFSGI
jgi:ADP-ribosylation factor GTPase-activating protein 2/3